MQWLAYPGLAPHKSRNAKRNLSFVILDERKDGIDSDVAETSE